MHNILKPKVNDPNLYIMDNEASDGMNYSMTKY